MIVIKVIHQGMTLIAKILLKITLKRLTPIEMFPKSLIRKGMFFKRMMLIELTSSQNIRNSQEVKTTQEAVRK